MHEFGYTNGVEVFPSRDAGLELPIRSSLINRALRGMTNSHVVAGTPRRVRLPISWDILLADRCLIKSWGAGVAYDGCVSRWGIS